MVPWHSRPSSQVFPWELHEIPIFEGLFVLPTLKYRNWNQQSTATYKVVDHSRLSVSYYPLCLNTAPTSFSFSKSGL